MRRSPTLWIALAALLPGALAAQARATGEAPQQPDFSDAYLDVGAGELHRTASASWRQIDESIVRYTARVQQRIAANIRTPLRDRTIYRNESAARVFWDRDGDQFIQVLGARAEFPGKEYADAEYTDEYRSYLDQLTIEEGFDPGGDRLVFGFADQGEVEEQQNDDDDFWVAHPLASGADSLYTYASGDTLVISLPTGRDLRVVELQVIPRVADVHRITGSLWIEPESGALVRAVYRLSQQFDAIRDIQDLQEEEEAGNFKYVPGFFKPWTFDMEIVAIDYSLWDLEVWLPRSMRVEGQAAAGILKFPVSMDLSYRIEEVVTENDLEDPDAPAPLEEHHFDTREEAMAFMTSLLTDDDGTEYQVLNGDGRGWSGSDRIYIVPLDPDELEDNEHLPPPIWEDAPGFASDAELEEAFERLAKLPTPEFQAVPLQAVWGWNRPDLIRYNRVEGPALGGKIEKEFGFLGNWKFTGSGFFGFADLEPKARITMARERLKQTWSFDFYRDITAVDDRGRPFGFGNSMYALFFGRDDGEYFLSSGASITLGPPPTDRNSWSLRGYVERQEDMDNEIRFSFNHAFSGDWDFRPNIEATEIEEVGGELKLSPWWGTDPTAAMFGLEMYAQGGAWRGIDTDDTGDYVRGRIVMRTSIPMGRKWKVGLEAAGGHAWGDTPRQRNWFLGSARTLRGYQAASLSGTTFGRGRLEIARTLPVTTVSVFSDAGWAGDYDLYDADDILMSIGIGGSTLDGLIRLDLSHGLRGPLKEFRFDLYLDAIL